MQEVFVFRPPSVCKGIGAEIDQPPANARGCAANLRRASTHAWILDTSSLAVLTEAGEAIKRTNSSRDLMKQLGQAQPRPLCSLVHKFGRRDIDDVDAYVNPCVNCANTTAATYRGIRGGSFNYKAIYALSSSRTNQAPADRKSSGEFSTARCARSAP
jgi:hypothetical protein